MTETTPIVLAELPDARERVEALTRRVAEVAHATVVAQAEKTAPVKAHEIMVYDRNALSLDSTVSALGRARAAGLVDAWGHGLWTPSTLGRQLEEALEDRILDDREEAA